MKNLSNSPSAMVRAYIWRKGDRNPLAPVVRYQELGDFSINFKAILHVTQFKNQYLMQHEFIKAIKKRFSSEGINIPYPTHTLVTYEEDLNIG